MAETVKIHLYEALVRFDEDGNAAAHIRRIKRQIGEDGVEEFARVLPAEPSDLPAVAAAIGEENARLVAEIDRLTAEKAALEGQIGEALKAAEAAETGRLAALALVSALQDELSHLGAVQGV
ncbi:MULTISPECIES: hypothetical protein [Methylobacterium]|uniref:Uncharacterized protein n=1 Tax=Methylobacterium jeotgali TaxID=381630 RepID=A0ABQ4T2W9_9HYPH|nr:MULTISPECIES: hypothetical protein [Methylobacterium]PIU06897.1 MAG: hypothetical protein COT56_07120 [Methylobacterium sp. CG09_land_8_20_14_0_10_71_15]PIU16109.1 MAG: hypothetical protein COT28_01440 [Methylobacterium sp. CG08_land_8_20_14_0_20_71_15]GBU19358.1 hypothetical protein AwMethylo_35730 [Methylobacterium sp.]GJE08613.1 hypothetical protein AOPFMNJM_3956 [Methylobacterium jeotgali]